MVDALGSGPSGGNTVEVRVLSWAPTIKAKQQNNAMHAIVRETIQSKKHFSKHRVKAQRKLCSAVTIQLGRRERVTRVSD